jgi:iron complex outermembrane receptor protein
MLPLICLLLLFPEPGKCSDLSVLSLDELLDVDVVSVAKVPGKVIETPAAITVITGEDLRRNGVRTIPEALRLAPGLHVYQIDGNKWAVSARGFASRFANKMLVMIDGRTVYSTLFSGVFWDVQDLLIDDIDRIEVIRGPGGTLWGANAVNGVINIISKDSADTQGGLVTLHAQTGPDGEASARYGGWLNDKTSYRLYGKFFDREDFDSSDGGEVHDGWHQGRAGFRMDMNATATDKFTLQGDIYAGESGETVRYVDLTAPYLHSNSFDAPVSGGNILGRWSSLLANHSEITLQTYYDHIERNESFIDETLDTVDVDFQHLINFTESAEVLYGLGYRYTRSDTESKDNISGIISYAMHPQVRTSDLFSAFLQGRFTFAARGELTLGTKLEHNDYTGFEWQPSARLLWKLGSEHSLWAAVSRTVRTPSRTEADADITGGSTAPRQHGLQPVIRLMGNDDVNAEEVLSYEAGYKGRVTENMFMDFSLYYNKYNDLVTGVFDAPPFSEVSSSGGLLIIPVRLANAQESETYGAELSCSWSLADWWRLSGGYTWFHQNTLSSRNSREGRQGFGDDQNATHLVSLISYMDLPHDLEINTALYATDALDGLGIGSHVSLDIQLSWHPEEWLTIAGGVKNLFDDDHQEFTNTLDGIQASEVPQAFYTKLTMTF